MVDTIERYISAGLSVIPVRDDKRPKIDWKAYQSRIATPQEYGQWSMPIAIVAGNVSGGIICIDFDDHGSAFAAWGDAVKKSLPDIVDKLVVQRTPSGGYHVVYRTDRVIENRKLAQKRGPDGKLVVLIETRGEGGYFLAAPSDGYALKRGAFETVQFIDGDYSDALLIAAISLNEYHEEYAIPREITAPIERTNGVSPFDDYDAKNTPIQTLVAHGWTVSRETGDKVMLCRAGKRGAVSATWNHVPGRFYVFTTSTEFDSRKVYKPSAVYAILEYGGDFIAASKQLMRDGYGTKTPEKKPVDYDTATVNQLVRMGDYRERIHAYYNGKRERGLYLGLHEFDVRIRFERGYLNIVTGIPTHGKSEFLDFIMMTLAMKHNWNFVVFSPENYPLEIYFDKLAEKYQGRSMYNSEPHDREEAIEYLDAHFDFVNPSEEELSFDGVLGQCVEAKKKRRIDGLIIDPWNEIEMQRPRELSESEYSGVCLRRLRKFARKHNLCIFLVAHTTKLQKIKDTQLYPVPTMYDISGSANFYNKADNGIVVYRDFEANHTDVYVKKVKYKNYGEIGMVRFSYDRDSGRYKEHDIQPGGFQ